MIPNSRPFPGAWASIPSALRATPHLWHASKMGCPHQRERRRATLTARPALTEVTARARRTRQLCTAIGHLNRSLTASMALRAVECTLKTTAHTLSAHVYYSLLLPNHPLVGAQEIWGCREGPYCLCFSFFLSFIPLWDRCLGVLSRGNRNLGFSFTFGPLFC